MADTQLQTLLQQSVAHYQAMDVLMQQLDEALNLDDPELLAELQGELTRVQELAGATDAQVGPLLPAGGNAALAALLGERRILLEALQAQNRLLSTKIHGILPVISDELAQLRAGRVAVSGYASGQQARGDRVRGAF